VKSIYIDSNVLLDVFLDRKEHLEDSFRVLKLVVEKSIVGYTSSVIIINSYYSIRKVCGKDQAMAFLNTITDTLNTLPVTQSTIMIAKDSGFNDFEDAVQYQCAVENGIECIITRNTKDYAKSLIPVYTPSEYILILLK